MDMSNAYGKWVRENLPGVPVIYDHFHVIKAIKQACGYRDFKYFRLKVFDLPNLKPPRPHAARGRATFPRTVEFTLPVHIRTHLQESDAEAHSQCQSDILLRAKGLA